MPKRSDEEYTRTNCRVEHPGTANVLDCIERLADDKLSDMSWRVMNTLPFRRGGIESRRKRLVDFTEESYRDVGEVDFIPIAGQSELALRRSARGYVTEHL
ncbi:hypothetical protein D9M68_579700 [compost metagenome]